jgi:hypothetical protein
MQQITSVIPPNKTRSANKAILGTYAKVCEAIEDTGENLRAPEYRQHSHESSFSGEMNYSLEEGRTADVHAIHVKVVEGQHDSLDSRQIKCEQFCPECCINDLIDRKDLRELTDEDVKRDYKVAVNDREDTMFIEKKDGSEFFIFVKH